MDTFLFEMSMKRCLHLRTSEMSIDLGRRIVHWARSAGFMDTLWVRLSISDEDLGHLGHYLGTPWG